MSVVSIRDVATAAGVSVGTVSNVLNRPEKVAEATVARVRAAIDELGFIRNEAARQLREGRSAAIGLVVLDVRNPYFTDVAHGVETAAAAAGLSVTLGNSDGDPAREQRYLELFEQQRVQGVLISPADASLERLRRLDERGIPVVLVDGADPSGALDSVTVDDVAGGRLAAEHLLGLGRRRLLVVAGPASLRQVADRLEGVRAAVAEVPGASLEVQHLPQLTVPAGRELGRSLIGRPASARPDAVFAVNDLLGLGVLQALVLERETLRVPEDIAVIGYDDIEWAASAVVPLSSVRQPREQLGRTALEALLARGAEGLRAGAVRFAPELVARRSTTG